MDKKRNRFATNTAVGAIELAKNWDKIFGTSAASTPPIMGIAANYGPDVLNAANTFPVGASTGVAGIDAAGAGTGALGVLGEVLGPIGWFNTLKTIAEGTTLNKYLSGGTSMPTTAQMQRVMADPAYQAGSFGTEESPGWTPQTIGGQAIDPRQITKLARGETIFKNRENPLWINPKTGLIEPRYTETTVDGVTTTVDNKTGRMTTQNLEGALSTPGVSDIIGAGGSATGGGNAGLGDYETYPTTGGVAGGINTPTIEEGGGTLGQTGGTNTDLGAGAGVVAGGLAAWLAKNGLGKLSDILGGFNDLPWWAKLALGAGAVGTIGSMVGGKDNGYNPNPPPKFPGQPATLPQGYASRTPLAPATDYYTYGQRPEQAFFTGTRQAALPSSPDRTIMPVSADPVIRMSQGGLNSSSRYIRGSSSGRADDIDAKLSPGEYVIDAETLALLGDGNNEAGARKLDAMRKNLRAHKGKALAKGRFSPNAKDPHKYMRNS